LSEQFYEIRAQSLEYLPIRVKATRLGGDYDPSVDPVEVALPEINVAPSTWKVATWQSYDGKHYANVLVGTGGDFALAVGDYDIFVRITDSPEVPVLRAGMLRII